MSVIYFTDKDLSCIYANLLDNVTRADLPADFSLEELRQFFLRIGICNRLAYQYTYHDSQSRDIVLCVPVIDPSEDSRLSLKKLIEQLDLLAYNCVTNSGRSFLDSQDKDLLDRLTHLLRLAYIRVLERQ